MTKRVMSKIISKIQFTIYSLLAFFFSFIIITYASLSYGITFPLIILPNFKAQQLYIKLDKKLILEAKRIDVTFSDNKAVETPLLETPKVSPILGILQESFSKINIESLYFDDNIVTFSYNKNSQEPLDNSLSYHGNGVEGRILFTMYEDYAHLKIANLIHKPSEISISGESIYEFDTQHSFTKLQFSLNACADLNIYVKDNSDAFSFIAESNQISDISPIVKLFKLKESITKWIVPYNKASSYQINEASGSYSYSDDDLILDTLYIAAKEKNVSYTFNEKLPAVKAPEVDISFSKGVLSIRPQKATYNEHKVKSSEIRIDFNQEHVLLDLDLKVKTRASQDIIDIVEAYNIPLPLLQESGETDVKLGLHVNLWTEEAYANGNFQVKDSSLLIAGVPYRVQDTSVKLNKTLLSIDKGRISYKDIFSAQVSGKVDLIDVVGDVYFDTDFLELPLSSTQLLKLKGKTRIQMKLEKERESYHFPRSKFSLNEQNITIKKGHVRMLQKFGSSVMLKDQELMADNILKAKINGEIDISKDYLKLQTQLSQINYQTQKIQLSSEEDINLNFIMDKNITHLRLLNTAKLKINKHNIEINPVRMRIKQENISINNANITVDDNISTKLSLKHQFNTNKASLELENTKLFSEDLLFIGPKIHVEYSKKDNIHQFNAKKLKLQALIYDGSKIKLLLNDLSKIHPFSPLLKQYSLREGKAKLSFKDDLIDLNINLKNFRPLLSYQDKEITDYEIKGSYLHNVLALSVNDNITLQYDNKLTAQAQYIDFNYLPILMYINEIDDRNSDKDELDISIKTKKCNISLGASGRKLIADTLNIEMKGDHVQAKLFYKKGGVLFESTGNTFSVYGHGLDDSFMNKLFKFSSFEGGSLSFNSNGNFDNYTNLINIKDTTIKDYTVLNNTLAFFNTIPALVTFSVPGYSKEGLKVTHAYAAFDINDSIATVKDGKLESKELIITVEGTSDLKEETLDLTMQVKTDIGSSAKDIPVVGYLIFGNESVSTTVRVKGDMSNPEVSNSAATSVIVAPYNILKRTVTYPLKLLDIFKDDEDKKEK